MNISVKSCVFLILIALASTTYCGTTSVRSEVPRPEVLSQFSTDGLQVAQKYIQEILTNGKTKKIFTPKYVKEQLFHLGYSVTDKESVQIHKYYVDLIADKKYDKGESTTDKPRNEMPHLNKKPATQQEKIQQREGEEHLLLTETNHSESKSKTSENAKKEEKHDKPIKIDIPVVKNEPIVVLERETMDKDSLIDREEDAEVRTSEKVDESDDFNEEVDPHPPRVATAEGIVEGVRAMRNGKEYYMFLGIPYAQTPPERFKAPKPLKPWSGIRQAKREGEPCSQYYSAFTKKAAGSEDCLYLNVITPSLNTSGLGVLFFIYGGAFKYGSSSLIAWNPDKLVENGVVVVTFNYRLGAFGFISSGDDNAPGNAGMKDMVAALRWVHRNIHMFSGGTYKVTIYGISTGAISVDYLTLSPMARGLFSQAISHSGSSLNSWAMSEDPIKYAYRLGKFLNITTLDKNELFEQLRVVDHKAIATASNTMWEYDDPISTFLHFVPTVEDKVPGEEIFLEDTPENILKSGRYIDVPYMQNFNELEGTEFLRGLESNSDYVSQLDGVFQLLLPADLVAGCDHKYKTKLESKLREYYFKKLPLSRNTTLQYAKMVGDYKFMYGIQRGVQLRMKTTKKPLYYLHFAYKAEPEYRKHIPNQFVDLPGSNHADDLHFVFTSSVFAEGIDFPPVYRTVEKRLITFITNFVQYGNPTPQISEVFPVKWTPVQSADSLEYMMLSETMAMKKQPFHDRYQLWKNLYSNKCQL